MYLQTWLIYSKKKKKLPILLPKLYKIIIMSDVFVSKAIRHYLLICLTDNNPFFICNFSTNIVHGAQLSFHHALNKCWIWESYSWDWKVLLLEGNLCNSEVKFIIQMDILVFFLHKFLPICKTITFYRVILIFFFFSSQPCISLQVCSKHVWNVFLSN